MNTKLRQHELGFYEIAEKPTTDELQKYYSDKYYQESRGSYEQEYSQDELKSFRNKLIQRHAALDAIQEKMNNKNCTSILDVGCGEGYAMAYFKEQDYTVKGIDFSSAGVESKNPECLENLITGDLFDLLQTEIDSNRRYDIVWLQNVLEHVLDPVELMNALRHLISPQGVAVITVPNDCSCIQEEALEREHIDKSFWVMPPDHLSYFDNQSLNKIAVATGWMTVDMLADFPIDWYLFHQKSNYVMDAAAGEGAHLARVQLENLFSTKPIESVLEFWKKKKKIGSGRNLTVFLKPE